MAILNIREIGDPVLRTEAKEVEEISDNILRLLDDMAETMYDAPGIGIAAPQVGISKRIILVDIGDGLIELINPEISSRSNKTYIDQEGCLSIPNQMGDVKRNYTIRVKGLNRDGEEVEIKAKGLLSRALQHEIDHLNGKLFVDQLV
ncbi:peptide deformylase [Halonatronum saccharophilum]|uniref:peptide deformylase n=1 Tax=Halonatronum saccharophilum TaxID=150060 RepID=UPI000482AF33|nr:peptide deformylase [Halonatronum saccharophilum]